MKVLMALTPQAIAEFIRHKTFELKLQLLNQEFKDFEDKWTKIYSKFVK